MKLRGGVLGGWGITVHGTGWSRTIRPRLSCFMFVTMILVGKGRFRVFNETYISALGPGQTVGWSRGKTGDVQLVGVDVCLSSFDWIHLEHLNEPGPYING